jgi:hypothetical protein
MHRLPVTVLSGVFGTGDDFAESHPQQARRQTGDGGVLRRNVAAQTASTPSRILIPIHFGSGSN